MASLEPTPDVLRTWLDQASAYVVHHLEQLADAPPAGVLEAGPPWPIDEEPVGDLPALLARFDTGVWASLCTPGPGYLAYVPGGGLPSAAIAELLAAVTNRFTGLTAPAPALARLEADVLAWLAAQVGYDSASRGLLTSGGSLANLCAVVAARHHHLGDTGDFRAATVYASEQAHHSVAKAARIAGISQVRAVPVDARRRMDPSALRSLLRADPGVPFLVVASAGTTNTGAIDPLPELADVCEEAGSWLHVDGAYGGAWALCPEGRRRLVGLERADSITLDPHKGMFLPYGTGCLLVREGGRLRAAFASDASYLRDLEPSATDPAALGPELSRPFRGLRLWLPLALHGASAFREALSEKLALAERLYRGLLPLDLEVLEPPQLTTVAFRARRAPDEPLDAWNARTAELLERIHAGGHAWLSSTTLEGVHTLRACIVSFRTHAEHVDALREDIEAALV